MSDIHHAIARGGRAPLEAVGPALRLRAIVCLYANGFDTSAIAALLGAEEHEIANAIARLRATAGAVFLDGRGERRDDGGRA